METGMLPPAAKGAALGKKEPAKGLCPLESLLPHGAGDQILDFHAAGVA